MDRVRDTLKGGGRVSPAQRNRKSPSDNGYPAAASI